MVVVLNLIGEARIAHNNEYIATKLSQDSPADPYNPGEQMYDTLTRVIIRGDYHGETQPHDHSDSSEQDGPTSPMSIDPDL